jgi:23S rRNA pseudouridine955/2504/2580 synthase
MKECSLAQTNSEITGVKVQLLTVDEGAVGQRLDNFLLKQLKGVPKTLIYRIIRKGEVRVNKGRCKPDTRLQNGDLVRIPPVRVSESVESEVRPGILDLLERAIVYEDDDLIAINKPHGLAVHGGSGLSYGVIEAFRVLRPGLKAMELVHRLDRDTSGLLLIAKQRKALLKLQSLLQSGGIDKRYLAWVDGKWPAGKTEITAPLTKNVLRSGERIVVVSQDGKACLTRFRLLKVEQDASLVEASPITGRTHQIRVHAKFAGHPIIGDAKYCPDETNRSFRDRGVKRLCLHAYLLTIRWGDKPDLVLGAPWEYAERLI